MRRFAAAGTRKDLDALRPAAGPGTRRRARQGPDDRLRGGVLRAGRWPGSPSRWPRPWPGSAASRSPSASARASPRRSPRPWACLRDEQGDRAKQLQYLQILGEVRTPGARAGAAATGLPLRPTTPLRAAALAALANYDDPAIAPEVLKTYGSLSEDVHGRRAEPARRPPGLGPCVPPGDRRRDRSIPARSPARSSRSSLLFGDPRINDLAARHFGAIRPSTSAELQSQISRLAGVIRSGPGIPKPGRQIFVDQCARCHSLFGKGGKVGPDLTTYRRDDLESMLLNIVNPERRDPRGLRGATSSPRPTAGP